MKPNKPQPIAVQSYPSGYEMFIETMHYAGASEKCYLVPTGQDVYSEKISIHSIMP